MGRPSLIAEVLPVQADKRSQATPLWSSLVDAHIHSMATHGMVITGTEIIDGVAYAQSWHCKVV
ncbi:hypothetical protein D3C72_2470250 [compost metagenome]